MSDDLERAKQAAIARTAREFCPDDPEAEARLRQELNDHIDRCENKALGPKIPS